jgi:hypothetical protein
MPEKWKLSGTLFDACNCMTLCPCNYAQTPTDPNDCRAAAVWRIEQGNYGTTDLSGLHFAMVISTAGNPLTHGVDQAAMILDEAATPEQRQALGEILGGKAGGLFGMLAPMIKQNRGVTVARFDYANDEQTWSVKAGGDFEVSGSFVKPPPDMPIDVKPRRAQTMDPLFSPTMEKVVGVTDRVNINAGGIRLDFGGRYSSAGRFSYEGG